jgi:hypothetical protein
MEAGLMAAHRLLGEAELLATLSRRRAVVYITVEWAVQERHSRRAFAEFVAHIEGRYPHLGASFWVLGEECEGLAEWCRKLKPTSAATAGYGAVVWLSDGQVMGSVEYAAAAGADGLLQRTLGLWGSANPPAPEDGVCPT